MVQNLRSLVGNFQSPQNRTASFTRYSCAMELRRIIGLVFLMLTLTACSASESQNDSTTNSLQDSSVLLSEGCKNLFEVGDISKRAASISKIRELVAVDPSYFDLLSSAVELDLIFRITTMENLKNLPTASKERAFTAISSIATYCG